MLTPLDDRVLVLVEAGERVTPGGLFIPDTASMTGNHRGTVVSVGSGHRTKKGQLRPLELKVGDQVLFSEYAGTEVSLENQNFKILRETDILGLVTK
ncbi:MAG: co-chaperone GroES [Bdellovibrionaceae bacterium]|nr:co-chaperone GroES [Pseudobdellovibrionaceae bacterium]